MNNDTRIDELLDGFLKGNLSQSKIEQLLEEQAITNVTSEINRHRIAAAALQRYSVLEQVQQVHKDYVGNALNKIKETAGDTHAKVIRTQVLKWSTRIAAMLILVATGWVGYQYITTGRTELYTEIYQPYNINTDRKDNTETLPNNIIRQFKDKNYTAVINTFRSLPVTNNREKFLAAYALQQTGDYQQAGFLLHQIINDNNKTGDRLYNDEAEFYLGLSYLKMKDDKKAFEYFKKINGNSNHTFHERISNWTLMRLKWLK